VGIGALGLLFAGGAGFGAAAKTTTQTQPTAHKTTTTRKTTMAQWSPDVQQALGISSADFKTSGLSKLTAAQLQTLETSTRAHHPDIPSGTRMLSCAVSTRAAGAPIRIFVTVAGDDAGGARKTELLDAIRSIDGMTVVDSAASADRTLRVVIQEQSMGKRIIGYTASYMTGTPCTDQAGDKKTDVEIKEQLGTYTVPKSADLAQALAKMLSQDIQPLRAPAASATP
jgi:hypothetical protein